jgi:sterol desaturase/sphingolipid hydroxylase (fatty acid hydroxylase superfamily)
MLSYSTFLVISGALFLAAERLWPRNPGQRLLRKGFALDLSLLLFHSEIGGWVVALALSRLLPAEALAPYKLLAAPPLWLEIALLWVVKDFVQWGIHNLLHRVPWLWRYHAIHHSSEELDWLSNWRFHPLETVVYQSAVYIPAFLLGFRWEASLICAFLSTGISHFAHANLRIRTGWLKYVLNTPELHIWHHVHPEAGPRDRNFAISFAFWDWIFGTAHCPAHPPSRIGAQL